MDGTLLFICTLAVHLLVCLCYVVCIDLYAVKLKQLNTKHMSYFRLRAAPQIQQNARYQ